MSLFWPKSRKCHFWPKRQKPIIRDILDTFRENQPLSRSENALLLVDAKSSKKCENHTFCTFSHFWPPMTLRKPPPRTLSQNHNRGLEVPIQARGLGVVGPEGGHFRLGPGGAGDSPHRRQKPPLGLKNTLKPHRCRKRQKRRKFASFLTHFWQISSKGVEKHLEAKMPKMTENSVIFGHFRPFSAKTFGKSPISRKMPKMASKWGHFHPSKTGFSLYFLREARNWLGPGGCRGDSPCAHTSEDSMGFLRHFRQNALKTGSKKGHFSTLEIRRSRISPLFHGQGRPVFGKINRTVWARLGPNGALRKTTFWAKRGPGTGLVASKWPKIDEFWPFWPKTVTGFWTKMPYFPLWTSLVRPVNMRSYVLGPSRWSGLIIL